MEIKSFNNEEKVKSKISLQVVILSFILLLSIVIGAVFIGIAFILNSNKDDTLDISEIQKYMPNYTEEQIEEIMNHKVSEEDAIILDAILDSVSTPNVAEVLEEDLESGVITYKDADGNIQEHYIDTDKINRSTEEVEASIASMLDNVNNSQSASNIEKDTEDIPTPILNNSELTPFIGDESPSDSQQSPIDGLIDQDIVLPPHLGGETVDTEGRGSMADDNPQYSGSIG